MTTTETTQAPSYEDFRRHQSSKWASLAAALTPGVPARVPGLIGPSVNKPMTPEQRETISALHSLKAYAKGHGFHIVIRTFGTEVWICRLRDEDAK